MPARLHACTPAPRALPLRASTASSSMSISSSRGSLISFSDRNSYSHADGAEDAIRGRGWLRGHSEEEEENDASETPAPADDEEAEGDGDDDSVDEGLVMRGLKRDEESWLA